jgi:hypothetical protein
MYIIKRAFFAMDAYPISAIVRLAFQAPAGKRCLIFAGHISNTDSVGAATQYATLQIGGAMTATYVAGTDITTITPTVFTRTILNNIPIPHGASLNPGKFIVEPLEGIFVSNNPNKLQYTFSYLEFDAL